MHAMATVFTKNYRRIGSIINQYCENGQWDYASIGGRYWGLIPVNENVKDILPAETFGMPRERDFPLAEGEPAPHTKYVSCARFRNINLEEAGRLAGIMGYGVLTPYTLIIDRDGELIEIDGGDIGHMIEAREFVNQPHRSYWYMIVVDYHY